ncbi:MAG: HAMP domain-containing histidine kinase [Bryobacterales bacterium]|nr:HAMP domain-containing histidine kinase [Bryobacterales bacterium]
MNRLRNRLLLAFLVATLAPLSIALWVTASLLERSLSLSTTREIDELSNALRSTGREYYQQSREILRADAEAGRSKPEKLSAAHSASWPAEVKAFWESKDRERFQLGGEGGSRIEYLVRRDDGVWRYTRPLGSVRMEKVGELYTAARGRVDLSRSRDFPRAFRYTLLLVAASGGVLTVVIVLFFAYRISRPVQKLTDALQRFAAGDMSVRVEAERRDEIGAALTAFNDMAEQLQQSRERLILLTRLSSWQALGRKMAHEVKNSLTPIRLTVEEMAARQRSGTDKAFFDQAAGIIVDEVNRLERRVRAFSELAAEPPVHLADIDVNGVIEERTGFLRNAHPEVIYNLRLSSRNPRAQGDEDLVRGILTNLLENAAEAAGAGGVVLAITGGEAGKVVLEVHDSGPGLSLHARETLFQPTISFKKSGMGLGLSIARKSALLSGGDIEMIDGELGGAAFRVTLREAAPRVEREMESVTEETWAQSES